MTNKGLNSLDSRCLSSELSQVLWPTSLWGRGTAGFGTLFCLLINCISKGQGPEAERKGEIPHTAFE